MDFSTFADSFSRVELFALVAVAVVAGVLLGPSAITVEGTDSVWVEVLSAVVLGTFVFLVGALSLWASKL